MELEATTTCSTGSTGDGNGDKKRRRMDQLIAMGMEMARVQHAQSVESPGRGTTQAQLHRMTPQPPIQHREALLLINDARNEVMQKRTWTQEEDTKLLDLVQRMGRDWAAIASEFPNWDRKRCRERFLNHLDPALRRCEWTSSEDDALTNLHREMGNQWSKIASSIPGRSPEDTKNRWLQISTGPATTKRKSQPWTLSEVDALRSLVDANGAKDWFFIASQIPGRTDLQCRQHWHRVLGPSIVKGRGAWTTEEETVVRDKVDELGSQWEKIASFLPGRLGKQCRERYLNHLDPSIKKTPWTADEDAILQREYRVHPNKWATIALSLSGRPENAVKNRWNALRRQKMNDSGREDAADAQSGAISRDGNTLR